MAEIASLSIGLNVSANQVQATLAQLDLQIRDFVEHVVMAGTALDKAFAGEAQKQNNLAAAFARTAITVEDIAAVSTQAGLQMNGAFSSQALQLQAIGASATAAAAQIEGMNAAGVQGAATPRGGGSVGATGAAEATTSLEGFGQALKQTGMMLTTYLTIPLALIGGYALKLSADFEQSMARIQYTFNLPKEAMKQVSDAAKTLGADVTLPGTSAVDAAHALQQLMSSGLSLKDSLDAARPVLQLSAVAMIDNKEAALITAQALNAYGLSGDQAVKVTDILTNGMRATGASAQDFAKGLTNAGAAAKLANQDIKDVATTEAILVRAGMTAPAAGTAITTALMRIINPTKQAAALMKEYNIHLRDLHGRIVPIPAIFEEFRKKLSESTTYTRAFGGDTEKMSAKLKEAEKQFKSAQKVMADLPPTIQIQTLRLADLGRQLNNVNEPARKLTASIEDQRAKINGLTAEMQRNEQEGLDKLARANIDATGRIKETALELQLQQGRLRELNLEMSKAGPKGRFSNAKEFVEQRLEIVRLENSIRSNKTNMVDWNKEIANNARQMADGLDSTKEKQIQIDHLTASLKENEKKLDEWNQAGRDTKTAELNAAIAQLNRQIQDNRDRLTEAAKATDVLARAQQNAQLVTFKMDQEQRGKIIGEIFGQRGFKPIEIGMTLKPGGFEAMKKQIAEIGTTNRIAVGIQDTLIGKFDGLKSAADNLALTIGDKLNPQMKGAVKWVTDLTERLNKMTPAQVEMLVNFGKVAVVLGPALIALGALVPLIPLLTGPIGLLTIAVGALGVAWATNFGGIQTKTKAVVTYIQNVGTVIGTALGLAILKVTEVGRNLWEGFIAGMLQIVPQVISTVSSIAQNLLGTIKTALGIKSPSTVMYEVGENIGQGLIDGINSQSAAIQRAANKVVDTVLSAHKKLAEQKEKDKKDGVSPSNNVPDSPFQGYDPAQNTGSSTGSGRFLGSSYAGGTATSPIFGKIDEAFQAVGKTVSNAQAKLMSDNALFASQVVQALNLSLMKQAQEQGLQYKENDVLNQGYLNEIRRQVASGQYSSVNVGGQTFNRPGGNTGGGAAPQVTQTNNFYGDLNNEADEKRITARIVTDVARSLRFGT